MDEDPKHARLLAIVAQMGPIFETLMREHAQFDVAYIILAAPAGVKHKTQALVTNIATDEAAKGLLTNALAWLDSSSKGILQ